VTVLLLLTAAPSDERRVPQLGAAASGTAAGAVQCCCSSSITLCCSLVLLLLAGRLFRRCLLRHFIFILLCCCCRLHPLLQLRVAAALAALQPQDACCWQRHHAQRAGQHVVQAGGAGRGDAVVHSVHAHSGGVDEGPLHQRAGQVQPRGQLQRQQKDRGGTAQGQV
jgi:hypothetical protein